MTGKESAPESGDSEVLVELQQRAREENRWRRQHRPQSGYFDGHPPREAYLPRAGTEPTTEG